MEGGTSSLPAFSTIFDGNQQAFDLQFDEVATDSGLALLITKAHRNRAVGVTPCHCSQ